jgi:RNA polymerase sigma factor (sigma-70 family)
MAVSPSSLLLGHVRKLAAVRGYNDLPDRELLRRFAEARDEGAFEVLLRRHGPMVLRVGQRVVHCPQDAEDVFQATFLVLARKAGSLAWRDSVANWLYEVTHRLAREANAAACRRRLHERRVPVRPTSDPLRELTLREAQDLFDEELNRLPTTCRAPLILCHLEGATQDEAARQLGCSLATCKRRLEQGRNLLRIRLSRRGLGLSAALSAVLLPPTRTAAAVPPSLVRGTLRAIRLPAAGLISRDVARLAGSAGTVLTLARCRAVVTLLVALGIAAAGAFALGGREDPPTPPLSSQTASAATSADPPPSAPGKAEPGMVEEGDRIHVQGRVLDPDGKPLAGAEVSVWWHYGYWVAWHPRHPQLPRPYIGARSGPDGRFRFTFAKSAIDDTADLAMERPWRFSQVVAATPGYGPAWKPAFGLHAEELTLRLVRDDVPVRGRVLDLQSRPVEGARLHVTELREGKDHILWQNAWAGLPPDLRTDREGRFTVPGVGRGRNFLLEIDGPGIAHQIVPADTLPADKRPALEVVVGPTKPITGTVRAKDTGKPLAGVVVYGDEDAHRRAVRAVTDADGRYRLLGLPKAPSYQLTVYSPSALGYLGLLTRVGGSEGLKPITANLELRRGVRLCFRVVDEQTGQPGHASCQYTPLPDNRHKIAAGDRTFPSMEFMHWHAPDKDGYFDFVAYPGPGVLFCMTSFNRTPFLKSRLAAADMAKGLSPTGSGAGLLGFVNASEAYRLIDTEDTAEVLRFDLPLRHGQTVTGKLVDPDGKPLVGALGYGLTFDAGAAQPPVPVTEMALPADTFTALGLCGELRTLTFVHKERKLIGHAIVRGTEKGPITVRLRPWGAVSGRLLDAQGKPLAQVRVKASDGQPRPGSWPPGGGEVVTDADGRFRLEYLDPTLKRDVILDRGARQARGSSLKAISVGPGETKDLGEIRLPR